MFDVPPAPGSAAPAAPIDMTQGGVPQNAMVSAPQDAPPQGLRKRGILAAILCASVGAAVGVFVTKKWLDTHR